MGYVSKGWNDPGVRVGDLLYIDSAHSELLKNNIYQMLNVCAGQGISFFFKPSKDNKIEIELWTPLYLDALTVKGLTDALKSLNLCREKLYELCPFARL